MPSEARSLVRCPDDPAMLVRCPDDPRMLVRCGERACCLEIEPVDFRWHGTVTGSDGPFQHTGECDISVDCDDVEMTDSGLGFDYGVLGQVIIRNRCTQDMYLRTDGAIVCQVFDSGTNTESRGYIVMHQVGAGWPIPIEHVLPPGDTLFEVIYVHDYSLGLASCEPCSADNSAGAITVRGYAYEGGDAVKDCHAVIIACIGSPVPRDCIDCTEAMGYTLRIRPCTELQRCLDPPECTSYDACTACADGVHDPLCDTCAAESTCDTECIDFGGFSADEEITGRLDLTRTGSLALGLFGQCEDQHGNHHTHSIDSRTWSAAGCTGDLLSSDIVEHYGQVSLYYEMSGGQAHFELRVTVGDVIGVWATLDVGCTGIRACHRMVRQDDPACNPAALHSITLEIW